MNTGEKEEEETKIVDADIMANASRKVEEALEEIERNVKTIVNTIKKREIQKIRKQIKNIEEKTREIRDLTDILRYIDVAEGLKGIKIESEKAGSLVKTIYLLENTYAQIEEETHPLNLALLLVKGEGRISRIIDENRHQLSDKLREMIENCITKNNYKSAFDVFQNDPQCFADAVLKTVTYANHGIVIMETEGRDITAIGLKEKGKKGITEGEVKEIMKTKVENDPDLMGFYLNGKLKKITVYYGKGRIEITMDRKNGTWKSHIIPNITKKLKKLINNRLKKYTPNKQLTDEAVERLIDALIEVSARRKGGAVIIMPEEKIEELEGKTESKNINDEDSCKKEESIIKLGTDIIKSIGSLPLSRLVEYIERDGHVIINMKLDIMKIGVKLNLTGGRHKSIEHLIRCHCQDCIGIVVSQDGPITLYHIENEKLKKEQL